MEPASTIIKLLGGPTRVSEIVGVHRSRPWNWTRPKSKGGTGGHIPQSYIPALLDYAQQNDIALTAENLLGISPLACAGAGAGAGEAA